MSSKCRPQLNYHTKESATETPKTVSTDDLIANKIADRTTQVSKTSPQNHLDTVNNEHDKEIPKERYITQKERQKIADDMSLI